MNIITLGYARALEFKMFGYIHRIGIYSKWDKRFKFNITKTLGQRHHGRCFQIRIFNIGYANILEAPGND